MNKKEAKQKINQMIDNIGKKGEEYIVKEVTDIFSIIKSLAEEVKIKPKIKKYTNYIVYISMEDKACGIKYEKGKFVFFGKEHIDEGVNIFFKKLMESLEKNKSKIEKKLDIKNK